MTVPPASASVPGANVTPSASPSAASAAARHCRARGPWDLNRWKMAVFALMYGSGRPGCASTAPSTARTSRSHAARGSCSVVTCG